VTSTEESREAGARWPGLVIGLGASLAALVLNARPSRSLPVRVIQRLSILGAAVSWVNLLLVRSWQQSWGATDEELRRPMPGDDLVSHPLMDATRSVSIEAPASAVWPWLVQMGYGRAGWYSYDRLDNAGTPSAERIVPELQELRPGDTMPTGARGGFIVEAIEPQRCLVLAIRHRGRTVISSSLRLEQLGNRRTRLVSRVRMRPPLHPGLVLLYLAMDFGELLMMRKTLLGIKRRAQR